MKSRRMSMVLVVLALGALMAPLAGTAAAAAVFTVDSTADTVDVAPGDGVCADSLGNCTLRAAVMEANTLAGADTITLPAGVYGLTITGRGEQYAATGDLDIRGPLVINGSGPGVTIIDGGGIDRVIEAIQANVSIVSVTIRNGAASGTEADAAIDQGGGIKISRCPDTCSFAGPLTVSNSVISGNSADRGGGISNNYGNLTVIGSTIAGNSAEDTGTASGYGGGIFNDWGRLTITGSTISGNHARKYGGGLFITRNSSAAITNSTISGNGSRFGTPLMHSGGIYHQNSVTTIVNSTISGNAGGIHSEAPLAWLPARVENSIIAGNGASDCSSTTTLISWGHNIAGDDSCGLAGPGDLNDTDGLLGPLGSNGGPTATHALLAGSPAIDAVPLADCTVLTDQRGVSRPQGSACDAGAVETSDGTPPSIVVGDVIAEATGASGAMVEYLATASDDVDGAVEVSCVPASGSLFPLGDSTVTCEASDAAGNTGSATFSVSVVDATAPTLVAGDVTAEATGASGAVVEFAATASDIVDGAVEASCVPASGSLFPLGVTTVICAATDAAGNTGGASFAVSVVDTTAPQTTIDAVSDSMGTRMEDGGATVLDTIRIEFSASDLVGVTGNVCRLDGVAVGCHPAEYSVSVGDHTFTVNAFDAAGNVDDTPATFRWTRLTPVQAAAELCGSVGGMGLPYGVATNLCAPLHEFAHLLEDGNPPNARAACNQLSAFVNQVSVRRRQGELSTTQATDLEVAAVAIRTALGC